MNCEKFVCRARDVCDLAKCPKSCAILDRYLFSIGDVVIDPYPRDDFCFLCENIRFSFPNAQTIGTRCALDEPR